VDRLVIKEGLEKRLADSLETALKLGEGTVFVEEIQGESHVFSENFACPEHGVSFGEISPRLFSFNNPYGACETCGGLGSKIRFDPELVVADPEVSLMEGAIGPWARPNSVFVQQMIESLAKHYGFSPNARFRDLSAKTQDAILYGSNGEQIEFIYGRDGRHHKYRKAFEGVIPNLERRFSETQTPANDSDSSGLDFERQFGRYMSEIPCPDCEGARLKKEARHVLIGGTRINELCAMSVRESLGFMSELKLDSRKAEIGRRVIKEIRERLGFLEKVGLGYLTIDRSSATLSGGESQRIRLATQVGSALVGVLYILDEPSIGLHQRDNQRLLDTLKDLRDQGNTVLVVEHDPETIFSADHIVDMGPAAGRLGGEVVFSGKPDEILNSEESLTGKYLSGREFIPVPGSRRKGNGKELKLTGARANNLKNIDVSVPLGVFTCVTGVSGSGKSTLIMDTIYRALSQELYRSKERPGEYDSISGLGRIDKVVHIDQSPIGRTPRSNPATYTGAFTFIRDLFANLPESRMRGYKPGRFSFNVKGGRCEACSGDGVIKIEMHFLPDVYVKCDVCHGARYNRETLEIKFKTKSIADVLDMTVNQAAQFLESIPSAHNKLKTIQEVGLGYIKLGQPATTLSGGEAQRIKLSKELSKRATGRTLYILDEPTTGLHFHDIKKLLDVLGRLVDSGNTVVVIEHNMDVIKVADHIIDLGPEGGDEGGRIIATGGPEKVAQTRGSYTGLYLKEALSAGKNEYKPYESRSDEPEIEKVVKPKKKSSTKTRATKTASNKGAKSRKTGSRAATGKKGK
jgi:excinuclease ABC subunit A